MRNLGRSPHGDFVGHPHWGSHNAARFHERRDETLVNKPTLDNYICLFHFLVITTAEVVDVAGVGAFILVNQC